MKKALASAVAALGLTGAALLATVPAAQAAPDTATGPLAATSVRGTVHGGNSIWKQVNPFVDKVGVTAEGESFLASCKRWGADGQWWYWVKFDFDGLTGHIDGDRTNIRHSWLPRCS
ncbi:hypothetical protein [Streptomyces sp. NPDC018972]|uniref:hypothetical protein n=1 Tax=Streptomyces sp. NPDC018972 TaxID=3365060 RepID=UPI00378C527B